MRIASHHCLCTVKSSIQLEIHEVLIIIWSSELAFTFCVCLYPVTGTALIIKGSKRNGLLWLNQAKLLSFLNFHVRNTRTALRIMFLGEMTVSTLMLHLKTVTSVVFGVKKWQIRGLRTADIWEEIFCKQICHVRHVGEL